MAKESSHPGEPNSPGEPATDQPFMKQFEEKILNYARATEAGKPEEAMGAAMEAFIMAAEEAARNPTPSLLAKQEAAECESRCDWAGAEAVYRKVLPLEEATGNFGLIAKAQMDLSRLLRVVGRLAEAWEFAGAATDSARRAQIFPVLVMALENQAFCAEAKQDSQAALAAVCEAVDAIEPGRIYDSLRARALINRARFRLLACQDLEDATVDLASGNELLNGLTIPKRLPGPLVALANWWEVKSMALERQADVQGAIEATTKAIELTRPMEGPYARFALAWRLDRLGALLKKSDDVQSAGLALAEAKSIREELRLPFSPAQ
jgi:hypothetical protein